MASEEWKPIAVAPGYECSNRGQFRSVGRTLRDGRQAAGTILTQGTTNRGRPKVNVRVDGEPVTLNVPRVVLTTFAGPPPPGRPFTRHHPNDDPWDNRWPENLSWCDRKTNEADKLERAKRLGYVEPRHAPSQQPAGNGQSPAPGRRSGARPVTLCGQRLRSRIVRWWG